MKRILPYIFTVNPYNVCVCERVNVCVCMDFHGYVISALEKKYVTDFCENVKPYSFLFLAEY